MYTFDKQHYFFCYSVSILWIGLILLTSDGRLPNSVLRGEAKQPKVYEVTVDRPLHWNDIEHLQVSQKINYLCLHEYFRFALLCFE